MPKVKSVKRVNAEDKDKDKADGENHRGGGWDNGGQLFGTENGENSFKGGGFKDAAKASETIALLEGKDVTYQYNVVNSMYNRAKSILKRTKDGEKRKNLSEAIATFEKWVDDYKAHSRNKENFSYLPLDVVKAFQPLARHYKMPVSVFLCAYEEAQGDYKKLRNMEAGDTTWDVRRNATLKSIALKEKDALYSVEEATKGLPTKEHLQIIMWAYSPDAAKVKRCVKIMEEKFSI